MLALLYLCQIRIRLWEEIVRSWNANLGNLLKILNIITQTNMSLIALQSFMIL